MGSGSCPELFETEFKDVADEGRAGTTSTTFSALTHLSKAFSSAPTNRSLISLAKRNIVEGFDSVIWAEKQHVVVTTLQSPNNMYRLRLVNGRMVICSASGATSYQTPEQAHVRPGWYLMMQSDCNLAIYEALSNGQRNTIWYSKTWQSESCKAGLRLMDTGDCHLVNSNGKLLKKFRWQPDRFTAQTAFAVAGQLLTEDSAMPYQGGRTPPTGQISPFAAAQAFFSGLDFGSSFSSSSRSSTAQLLQDGRQGPVTVTLSILQPSPPFSNANWLIKDSELEYGQQIGRGSFGMVHHGKWMLRDVAIKTLLAQTKMLEAFRAEVGMISQLWHPNIVAFYGAVVSDSQLAIITAFAPRRNLFNILHRARADLDPKRRLNIALDIARGMEYLHTRTPKIVHKDLKSANLQIAFFSFFSPEGLNSPLSAH
eukprot:gene10100-7999_t